MGFTSSEEAARAFLDWLAIVTRDEIAAVWPRVETVAQALVARRTLTAAEVKTLLARRLTRVYNELTLSYQK